MVNAGLPGVFAAGVLAVASENRVAFELAEMWMGSTNQYERDLLVSDLAMIIKKVKNSRF